MNPYHHSPAAAWSRARCLRRVPLMIPVLFMVMGLLFARPLPAQVINIWTNTVNQFWDNLNNWSLHVPPTTNQSVYITNSGTKSVLIDNATAGMTSYMTVSNLTVSGQYSANYLVLTNTGTNKPLRVLDSLTVGKNGYLTMTNSALRVEGTTSLAILDGWTELRDSILELPSNSSGTLMGSWAGTTGILNMSGESRVSCYELDIGYQAPNAIFTQNGGLCAPSSCILGYAAIGKGTYNLNWGRFQSPYLSVGHNGKGYFRQGGGTNQTGSLFLGTLPSGAGTNDLLEGTMNVRDLCPGYYGQGEFNQRNGQCNITNSLAVGYLPGSTGAVNLISGTMTSGSTDVGGGGSGRFTQTGGNHLYASLDLGSQPGGTGEYKLDLGYMSGYGLTVGAAGTGEFNQQAGYHYAGDVFIGSGTTASGSYNLTNGTLDAVNTAVGYLGTGVFRQVGGTHAITYGLYLGELASGTGIYNLSGGSVSASLLTVGTAGWGLFAQSGGQAQFDNLTVALSPGSGGTCRLEDGTLGVVFPIHVGAGGSFSQGGGTCNADLVNFGTYEYSGGSFAGRLENRGSFQVMAPTFTAGNGLANYTDLAVAAGRAFYLNGLGLDNEGTLTLEGSLISGAGPFTNNNQLSGHGIIGGTGGFVNNGFVDVREGHLYLEKMGVGLNLGGIDLSKGNRLWLQGGALINQGTLNLNEGGVSGTTLLANDSGGTITGPGSILCPFANSGGLVLVGSGVLNIAQNYDNYGAILLTALTANLTGGTLANYGSLQGTGNVGQNILNSGTIEASGGSLFLSGTVVNQGSGLMLAGAGNTLLATRGLSINYGIIHLTGGTFENNGYRLAVPGQVSGHGSFRAGGWNNSGRMSFSGGPSTIYGSLLNQAGGGRVDVAYTPAFFTGNVTNMGLFKITDTTVTFGGVFTNGGAYLSDPAANSFADLSVGPSGYLVGGAGDSFNVSGSFVNRSAQNALWDTGAALLSFKGGGAHTLHVPGADLGRKTSGYTRNFAWDTLVLGAGQSLVLRDGNSDAGAALYVRALKLADGLSQVSAITGNGVNLYYDPSRSENAYLQSGTYSLAGGGVLAPVQTDSLRIISIVRNEAGTVILQFTHVEGRAYRIQYKASLDAASWQEIANPAVTFPSSGTAQWVDDGSLTGGLAGDRYYRVVGQ